MTEQKYKAVRDRDTKNSWQLEGESNLHAITIPDPPSGGDVTVRITHSNVYAPFDGTRLFVRLGDPATPTEFDDLDSASDWVAATLVEELVWVGDDEILRSDANEPFEEETPWFGTFEATLDIPAGSHTIEIKLESDHPELLESCVLADWSVSAS